VAAEQGCRFRQGEGGLAHPASALDYDAALFNSCQHKVTEGNFI
jgi:hypothetical protein